MRRESPPHLPDLLGPLQGATHFFDRLLLHWWGQFRGSIRPS